MQKTIPSDLKQQAVLPEMQQPVRRFQSPAKRKLILSALGFLGLLLIGAGLLTTLQLISTDQSLFQRAAGENQVQIAMSPTAVTLAPNQEATITLTANTGTLQMSAADIQLLYSPSYLTVLSIEPSNPFSVILRAPTISTASGSATFAIGATPTNALVGTGSMATVKIKAGTTSGTTSLSYDATSQVAAFGSNTNRALITGRSTVTVAATGEPTDSKYQLTTSYLLSGVDTEGVQIPTEISLRYMVGEEKVVKTYYNRVFTSDAASVLRIVATPLDQDFDLDTITSDIEVLIKPEAGLRKLVGKLPKDEASREGTVITTAYTDILVAGDIEQSEGNINRISVMDIADLIRHLGDAVEIPVSSSNRRADLNHDGVIGSTDLSALLANYTATTVRGDSL